MNNSSRKKLLVIATGGTIASGGSDGLRPVHSIDDIINFLPQEVLAAFEITAMSLMNLDSSEICEKHWSDMAKCISCEYEKYDGIVLTHGTDTMAYTASALSFMLCGITIPVVITGSQLPITDPDTDAVNNLLCALELASSGVNGVFVAFNGKVVLGSRAVKVHTTDFDAFHSINAPYVAEVGESNRLEIKYVPSEIPSEASFSFDMSAKVLVIKITPGFNPNLLAIAAELGYRGIIIEEFGTGGVPDMTETLEELAQRQIPVVLKSQCLYGESSPDTYLVGRNALKAGVIRSYGMTTETAYAKLKWLLAKNIPYSKIKEAFETDVIGEIGTTSV